MYIHTKAVLILLDSFHVMLSLLLIGCAGVGQVVLQVAAATPCKCFGIEKSFWPALYAKVTSWHCNPF